jgi:hypothetical protein
MSKGRGNKAEVNETTRLLEQSVRIARENETLGEYFAVMSLVNCMVDALHGCVAERTVEEVMEQGNKLDNTKDQV